MSQYTYEFKDQNNVLEKYEWDNVWWEQANRDDLPRVLYIGDSISCGTRTVATASADGKLLFDGFGSSKALDNPFLLDSVRMFAKQQKFRSAVLFNNGLHGWHLNDDEEYPYYYEQILKQLIDEFKDTPVFVVLTTSVADTQREERVRKRNEAAAKIAAKYGLPVIDLYSVSVEFSELRQADGVHFSPEGYKKFAERIILDLKMPL
ncbi:MAG: SGNH/GDSL hydrolase family protein [Clostridia bacterium]|nr:SGNH/GDSL hydrolase family protein [Clostridia bacterium]